MSEPTNEQLAQWIEAGLATPGVVEHDRLYLAPANDFEPCRACALGLAVIGKYGSVESAITARKLIPGGYQMAPDSELAFLLGIPQNRADRIERPHIRQDKSAAQIAGMLRRGEI